MSKLGFMTLAVFSALVAAPAAALAQPASLVLVIGGEAYDGPPKFEVSFNGQRLGEGSVDAAIDTATAGRFADASAKSSYLQTFEFPIADDVFSADGDVRLHFTNEAYGGDGSNRDRNLYVFSVAVNGRAVPAAELRTETNTGIAPSAILGEYLVLADGTTTAVAEPPPGGWPLAGTKVASATVPVAAPATAAPAAPVAATPVVPKPAAAAPLTAEPAPPKPAAPKPAVAMVGEAAPVAAVPASEPVAVAPPTPVPVVPPAAVAAPATPAAVAKPAATATASVQGNGAAQESPCGLDQLYNVVGFNENSNELTPKLQQRLDQILADIGDHECVVQVVGYSSTVGDYATNALFAVERAQNVLHYLREKGLKVAKATATGAGATTEFGADPPVNRRVVITVSP